MGKRSVSFGFSFEPDTFLGFRCIIHLSPLNLSPRRFQGNGSPLCLPRRVMSAFVKVFGCRPLTDGAAQHGRPASENLQGRKPREARRGWFVTHYGDLSAANAARD